MGKYISKAQRRRELVDHIVKSKIVDRELLAAARLARKGRRRKTVSALVKEITGHSISLASKRAIREADWSGDETE